MQCTRSWAGGVVGPGKRGPTWHTERPEFHLGVPQGKRPVIPTGEHRKNQQGIIVYVLRLYVFSDESSLFKNTSP